MESGAPLVDNAPASRTPRVLLFPTDPDLPIPVYNDRNVPYGAGMAEDGNSWYIDPRIPEWWAYRGRRWRVWKYIGRHEFGEWRRMLNGEHYDTAHPAAEEDEHAAMRADGADDETIAAYEAFLKPLLDGCLADAMAGAMRNIPFDLYRGPYRDSGEEYLLEPSMQKALTPGGEGNGVEVGDEVYYKHNNGNVRTGKVTARGKHGFTCKSGRDVHRVMHDRYVAHRTRVAHAAKIVDEGEDGALAELPDTGRRIFLHYPEDDGDDMGKGLFLFKADPPKAGRPGLILTDVTDKAGHATKRWKSSGGKPPPKPRAPGAAEHGAVEHAAVGDHLKFAGGAGEVTARGKDGVTVRGTDGQLHMVRNDDAQAHRFDAAAHGRSKLSDADVAKFPEHAGEPTNNLEHKDVHDEESAYNSAREAIKDFDRILSKRGGVADKLGAEVFRNDSKGALAHLEEHPKDPVIMIAALKGAVRAREKAEKDPAGWAGIRDLVRGSIVVSKLDQVPKVLRTLKAAGIKFSRIKNRFTDEEAKKFKGYRDILANIELPNGHIAELQVHIAPMLLAKQAYGGHAHYEVARSIDENKTDKGEKLEPDDQRKIDGANSAMVNLYGHAWKHAHGNV